MLLGLPAGLLIITILLMLLMRRRQAGRGVIWSTAAFGSTASTLASLFLFKAVPVELALKAPVGSIYSALSLRLLLDQNAWVFQTAILSILSAVLLTATRRQSSSGPDAWFGSMGFALLGLFALQAGSLPMLLIAWFLVDTLDLIIQLSSVRPHHDVGKLATSFALRYMGILVGMVSVVGTTNTAVASADSYLFLAVMFRLGAFPFWSYWGDLRELTGMGTMMLAVRFATALLPMSRLESGTIPPTWVGFFTVYCLLLMLFCALRWLRLDPSVDGRVYWLTGYSLAASVCVVHNQAGNAVAWAITILLAGSALFLLTDRSRLAFILVLAGIPALTGLPYTPVAGGWTGLLDLPLDWRATPFILAHVLFLAGFLRHVIQTPESTQRSAPLARFAYPAGLIILLVMPWLIMLFTGAETPLADWWAGFASFALLLALIIIFRGFILENEPFSIPENRFWKATSGIAVRVDAALRQDWLVLLFNRIAHFVARITAAISNVLEGDGGFLWVLLFLALFVIAVAGGAAL